MMPDPGTPLRLGCPVTVLGRPIVTRNGGGVRGRSEGVAARREPRVRPVRHPGGVPAAGRHPPLVGFDAGTASMPAASRAARPGGRPSPWRGGWACCSPSAPSASRSVVPALRHRGRRHPGQHHVLRRLHLLHHGLLPAVHGGGVQPDRTSSSRTATASPPCCASGTAASTGGRRASS